MKYYVISGQLRYTIGGPHINNSKDAACEAFLCLKNKILNRDLILAPLINVNERGFEIFEHELNDEVNYDTREILESVGLIKD